MAKKRKAAGRATSGRSTKKRAAPARGGTTQAASLFNPSGWINTLLATQTGRVIVAEALVAAAGAAAAVLMRSESGARAGKAMLRAGREGTAKLKEAASGAARTMLGDGDETMPAQDPAQRLRNPSH